MTWRYVGDWRFTLVLGRAFLLQVMHPTIAAGVADHSMFQVDPWGRLRSSWALVLQTIYEPNGEQIGGGVRWAHKHITGFDHNGQRYHAFEPEAYWWVLATVLDSTFTFAQRFARPMTAAQRGRTYAETREIGARFGLREVDMPETLAEFDDWYAVILNSRIEDTPTARDFLAILSEPPPPHGFPRRVWSPVRPLAARVGWATTIGMLPQPARKVLNITWSTSEEIQLRTLTHALRMSGALPIPMRYLPIARRNLQRSSSTHRA